MVAIKGMSMPSCCHWDCPLCNEDGGECMLGSYNTKTDTTKKRACDCPLVELEKWISVKDRLPSKNGRYLVTYRSITDLNGRYIKTVEFTENLTKLDNYDFPKNEYNRAGFYGYDSDFGYYEVTKVLAWMELPAVYKGE